MDRAAGGRPLAVVTGASAGIGAAIARRLAREGFDLLLGARRGDLLAALSEELGARWRPLDVADPESVRSFCAGVEDVAVLVNNAGGARGLDPVESAPLEDWRWMWEVNVLGLVAMTKELLPALERSGGGLVVNISSTAAMEVYEGGGGYTAAKHAVHAISRTLRLELAGRPIRVTEVCPGMVETDFSLNRFAGDAERAESVYQGVIPLTADDVADVVAFAATRPAHVDLDQIVMRPVQQAASHKVVRRG
ncbi:MAG: SDR family NAD(P)-dependent oxidoreductase [Candidatus Dormiibacterota bacterium]